MPRESHSPYITKLKIWMGERKIEQMHIHKWTKISLGTVNKLVLEGNGNGSTKKLVLIYLQTIDRSLTEKEFTSMLKLVRKPKK